MVISKANKQPFTVREILQYKYDDKNPDRLTYYLQTYEVETHKLLEEKEIGYVVLSHKEEYYIDKN